MVVGEQGTASEASIQMSETQDSLKRAYLSLLEVERAGGNVTELVMLLNVALDYYTEAEREFKAGKYDSALELADKCIDMSTRVIETDISMIVITEHVKEESFRNQLYLSIGAICIIVICGILGWELFKNYYQRTISGSSPEIVNDG